MSAEIILDFDAEDNPVVSVKGVAGSGCKDLTRSIERVLGSVTSDTPTREMQESERNEQRVQNRG